MNNLVSGQPIRLGHLLWKTGVCFVLINLIYALIQPMQFLGKVSVYGGLVPYRARFSFVEGSQPGVNAINLDEMFAAHEISAAPNPDEYRVGVFGSSAVWGYGMAWDTTLSACLTARGARLPNGRRIRAFNLGYPQPSGLRDALIMQRAVNYQLDAILWFVGGVSLFRPNQTSVSGILDANPRDVYQLLDRYPIYLPPDQPVPPREKPLWARTLVNNRNELATWLNDQIYGLRWQQTQVDNTPFVDVVYDERIAQHTPVLDALFTLQQSWSAEQVTARDLAFDVISAMHTMTNSANVPLLMFFEPMWTIPPNTAPDSVQDSVSGADLRYNVYYPRWYFDLVRQTAITEGARKGWTIQSWYDALPNRVFTDSPFHYSPEAACMLADKLIPALTSAEQP